MTNTLTILTQRAEQLSKQLVEILEAIDKQTPLPSEDEEDSYYWNERPAVVLAENIARDVLKASRVQNLGGCPLCRS